MPARSLPAASPASRCCCWPAGRTTTSTAMRPPCARRWRLWPASASRRCFCTNAAGSLDPAYPPGAVMLIEDHINFAGANPLIGEPTDRRFVGLTEAYDRSCADAFAKAAEATGTPPAQGRLYVVFRAVLRDAGGNPHGAHHGRRRRSACRRSRRSSSRASLGLRVAACSVITNLAAGMTGTELSHQETKDVAPLGGRRLATILKKNVRGWGRSMIRYGA